MLQGVADVLVYQWLGLVPGSMLGEALNFFVYDSLKIFIMLTVIIFAVSMLRTYFPPEKTKKILSHKREFFGNIVAALLGIVTPFCSCSAVPVFIGFIESGVPLGITFSFLIASPMVNEVALVMLWGLLGWQIAAIYIVSGVTIAVVAGYLIGKFKLEHLVEDYVYQMKVGAAELVEPSFEERLRYSREYTRDILKKIWLYVIIAIGIGGFIHGYAPEDFLVRYAGKDNIWAVPMAVAIGVPLYSNAAGVIPIVTALMQKGMSVGTALAFMMAVTALSFPEMVILRNVLKPKLIAIFITILAVAIIFTGYLFNAIL
ncbi:permease [Sporomusa sphaeroides]|uniref:permease n=1 Tax=Sporomusa sphaeroides TaxID=47679 RepID=UPI002C5D510A|nr:permease [Sporomusa sphaeroides]HML35213.1 permease [Sporomusa sphaeroides]